MSDVVGTAAIKSSPATVGGRRHKKTKRHGMSVKALKKTLKKAGLKQTGKKATLVKRAKKAHLMGGMEQEY